MWGCKTREIMRKRCIECTTVADICARISAVVTEFRAGEIVDSWGTVGIGGYGCLFRLLHFSLAWGKMQNPPSPKGKALPFGEDGSEGTGRGFGGDRKGRPYAGSIMTDQVGVVIGTVGPAP